MKTKNTPGWKQRMLWFIGPQFIALYLAPSLFAQSNIPIGSWRTHFSYQQAKLVALAGERVYCAAQNGLFYFDQGDNSLNILSKLDGLSDVGIVAMDYQLEEDMLLLAYRSNLIDVVSAGKLGSFGLLQTAQSGEQINEVTLSAKKAYVATNLGVRVLQIDDENGIDIGILESYTRLSSSGEPSAIYDVAILKDSIFLATDEGVIANSLAINVNRQNFASWKRFEGEGMPGSPVKYIGQNGDNIFATFDNEGVYQWKNGQWIATEIVVKVPFSSLHITPESLVAVAGNQIQVLTDRLIIFNTPQPSEAIMDSEGIVWIADEKQGLIRKDSAGQEVSLLPDGPLSDDIYSIQYAGERIFTLLDSTRAGFSTFAEGKWINYDPSGLAGYLSEETVATLVDVDYLPAENSFYFASLGNGLIRWEGDENFTMISSQSEDNSLANDLISSVLVKDNTLWFTNYEASSSLHRYDAEEISWQAFAPGGLESRFPVEMVLPDNDFPWLLSSNQGAGSRSGESIIAYNVRENESISIRSVINAVDLPGNVLTDLVEDKAGQLWLAGNEGITYFPAPLDIFYFPTAVKPIFENQFLLFGDYVSSIAIDGGNRKWIGTRDGVWLFSETAETLVEHFTSADSPLPSDHILDIAIDEQSGEVFFLTDKGMVSYRGTATEGKESQQTVKIFPNPVPAGFDGQVGIEGLVTNANVKITTISGTLVRNLEAEGGTAAWDVKDYNGSRVGTGVYLVFSASEDGSQTFIAKVAVIN